MPIDVVSSPGTVAAYWSAVAATASAAAAGIGLFIQHRNLVEAARPELIFEGWGRETRQVVDGTVDVVTIAGLKNVGRGSAFNLWINAVASEQHSPLAAVPTTHRELLVSNDVTTIAAEMYLVWRNVPRIPNTQLLMLANIDILAFDLRGLRYTTRYQLLMSENTGGYGFATLLAPGLWLLSRTTKVQHQWLLRLRGRAKGIPLIAKLFK